MIADAIGTVRARLADVAVAAIPRRRTTTTTTDVVPPEATALAVAAATTIAGVALRASSTKAARGTDVRRLVGLANTVPLVLVIQRIPMTLVGLLLVAMTIHTLTALMLVRTMLALLPPADVREAPEAVLPSTLSIPLVVTRITGRLPCGIILPGSLIR